MSGATTTTERAAPPATASTPATPTTDTGTPASAYGKMADGGFKAKLGRGLVIAASDFVGGKYSFESGPQPLPGVTLRSAELIKGDTLKVLGNLNTPLLEEAEIDTRITASGEVSIQGTVTASVQIPALRSPKLTLSYDENGQISGELGLSDLSLLPDSLSNKAEVTASGTLALKTGKFSGEGDVQIAYTGLGTGSVEFKVSEAGEFSGGGTIKIAPPFMNEISAEIKVDEARNLTGTADIALTGQTSPVPGLTLSGGTVTLGYENGTPSADFADFKASYSGFADASLETLSIKNGAFEGKGAIALTVPKLEEASGTLKVSKNAVSGSLAVTSKAFPEGLVSSGSINASLSEQGKIALAGTLGVKLGSACTGQLAASYDESGKFSLGADVTLTVPGLQSAQVSIAYKDGKIEGTAQVPIDTALLLGLQGDVTVTYSEGKWSGETEISYSADNGKLSGTIKVTMAQKEDNSLEVGGSGSVTAQIAPRLEGTLTAEILPGAKGIDVSGEIVVTEPLELFKEEKLDKELFSYDQKIPLWGILVAVIGINAGVRAGIGPGVFRNIKVEGYYTVGADKADPSLSISGELFIPAFVEGYVGIKAGLGLSVVLGSLTGGIEGVATAGLYGAISVIPELSYANGDWGIEGTATMAAGARLKLSLNAWAEVEALWITVWENSWPLTSWEAPIGPDLALQAQMAYKFGKPDPPTLTFDSSKVDTQSLIQSAMPKDSPPKPGSAKKPDNQAKWKGPAKEEKKAPVPADQQAKAAKTEKPPQPQAKKPKGKDKGKPGEPGKPGTSGKGGIAQGAPGSASPKDKPGGKPKKGTPGGGAGKGAQNPSAKDAQGRGAKDAATPDPSAKGAVPKDKAAQAEGPRYPKPITLATLDEPPALTPRTKAQEREDLNAALSAIKQAKRAAADSAALADYFPKIKRRFRLTSLGYEGNFKKGFKIIAKINPDGAVSGEGEPIAGAGSPPGSEHKTDVQHKSGSLGGDTVGLRMTASPLGPDHKKGSGPSGQATLMGKIPTDPKKIKPTGSRYIRGHLLNDNLGGPGTAQNLFPITAQANAEHHSKIEDTVKNWVNTRRFWVRYTVEAKAPKKLSNISAISGAKSPASDGSNQYINAAFVCEASVLGLDLQPVSGLTRRAVIQSIYEAEPAGAAAGAKASEVKTIKTGGNKETREAGKIKEIKEDKATLDAHTARDEDLALTVQTTARHKSTKFPGGIRKDLTDAIAADGEAEVRNTLLGARGFGPVSARLLFEAYKKTIRGEITDLSGYSSDDRKVLSQVFNAWGDAYRDLIA